MLLSEVGAPQPLATSRFFARDLGAAALVLAPPRLKGSDTMTDAGAWLGVAKTIQ